MDKKYLMVYQCGRVVLFVEVCNGEVNDFDFYLDIQ